MARDPRGRPSLGSEVLPALSRLAGRAESAAAHAAAAAKAAAGSSREPPAMLICPITHVSAVPAPCTWASLVLPGCCQGSAQLVLRRLRCRPDSMVAWKGYGASDDHRMKLSQGSQTRPETWLSVAHARWAQELMQDPVVAADGHSYERAAIQQWLDAGHRTSPMTNLRLPHRQLTPNHSLRSAAQEWQAARRAKAA
jgi:hypothetical protein